MAEDFLFAAHAHVHSVMTTNPFLDLAVIISNISYTCIRVRVRVRLITS